MENERYFYKDVIHENGEYVYKYYEVQIKVTNVYFIECEKVLLHTEIVAFSDPTNDKATGTKKTYKLVHKEQKWSLIKLKNFYKLSRQPVIFVDREPTFYNIKKELNNTFKRT